MNEVAVVGPLPSDPAFDRAQASDLPKLLGRELHEHGQWPKAAVLQKQIVRDELDWDAYQEMGRLTTRFVVMKYPEARMALTVLGMAASGVCQQELECLAQVVPVFLAAYTADMETDLPATVTSDQLRDQLQLDDSMVAKLPLLLEAVSLLGFGNEHEGLHIWTVSEAVYRFRAVKTTADLVAVVAGLDPPRLPSSPSQPLFPSVLGGLGGMAPQQVTIELSLEGLHPAVAAAAQPHFLTRPHLAITEAYGVLRELLREKSGSLLDTQDLVSYAFKQLALDDLTTETGQNVQEGARLMALGVTKLLRHPNTHGRPETEQAEVLEALATISLLVRHVERAVPQREETSS